MRAWLISLVALLVVVVGVWFALRSRRAELASRPPVEVRRGTIVKNAVATGRIEPKHEVSVRSGFSGLVGERFVKLGDVVNAGDPLLDVRQETTALSVIQAKRSVDAARRQEEAAREFVEGDHLQSYMLRMLLGPKHIERMGKQAVLARRQTEESLEFLQTGRLSVDNEVVDTIVRAPVGGQVIDLVATPGKRVIPVGAFQEATVVAVIADMDRLEFRGTVDEIDVGRLAPGMPAEIRIGALPDASLAGVVEEVGLKAKTRDSTTLFDLRIEITEREGQLLRSGYSATSDIIVEQRENVLIVPERVIEFGEEGPFVRVAGPDGAPVRKDIEIGLSDGLNAEVVAGLEEGEPVLEKVFEKIN